MKFNKVVAFSRTIHIYVTVFACLLMMFFAVTGVLLDHEEWLNGAMQLSETKGIIAPSLLAGPDKLMIVEELRAKYNAKGAVSTFDVEDDALRVELKGPGRHTEAEIDRKTGAMVVKLERRGFLVRLDDLHRGKDTGKAWRWVLDFSAVFLFVGALTGILMWFALPRRRAWGIAALISSTVILVAIYLLLVP
jgi:uncharacterized protein